MKKKLLHLILGTLLISNMLNAQTHTWTGNFDSTWNISINWSPTTVPTSTSDILIPAGLINNPTTSSAVTFNSLTIEDGASLIPGGTMTGPVTYTRNLPTDKWYFISPPFSGSTFQALVADNNLATGILEPTNIGLSDYDNNGFSWEYARW